MDRGYSPWSHKALDAMERLAHTRPFRGGGAFLG